MNTSRLILPEGQQFGAILADPPWPIAKPGVYHGVRRRTHYDRMSIEEIKAIDVASVCHPDAHLWLWTTNPHLEDALEVMHTWGFEYKTLMTWTKKRFGTGWWLRSQTEHVILAARSTNLRRNPGNMTTILQGDSKRHSMKPKEIYERVEALSPGPYLELFAREQREGWTCLGSDGISQSYNDPEQSNPFSQNNNGHVEVGDSVIRGIGGFTPDEGLEVVYLEKVIVPRRAHIVSVKGRRVTVDFVPKGRSKKVERKVVSIDKLRTPDYLSEVPSTEKA